MSDICPITAKRCHEAACIVHCRRIPQPPPDGAGDERAEFELALARTLEPHESLTFKRDKHGEYVAPYVRKCRTLWQAATRLASAPAQEPVATIWGHADLGETFSNEDWVRIEALPVGTKLYASPPADRKDAERWRDIAKLANDRHYSSEAIGATVRNWLFQDAAMFPAPPSKEGKP